MKDDTIIALGAVAAGGFLLWTFFGKGAKDAAEGAGTAIKDTGSSIGETAKAGADAAKDILSITDPIKATTSGVSQAISTGWGTVNDVLNRARSLVGGIGTATTKTAKTPSIDYVTPIQRALNAGAFDKYFTPSGLQYAPAQSPPKIPSSSGAVATTKSFSTYRTSKPKITYNMGLRSGFTRKSNVIFKR